MPSHPQYVITYVTEPMWNKVKLIPDQEQKLFWNSLNKLKRNLKHLLLNNGLVAVLYLCLNILLGN